MYICQRANCLQHQPMRCQTSEVYLQLIYQTRSIKKLRVLVSNLFLHSVSINFRKISITFLTKKNSFCCHKTCENELLCILMYSGILVTVRTQKAGEDKNIKMPTKFLNYGKYIFLIIIFMSSRACRTLLHLIQILHDKPIKRTSQKGEFMDVICNILFLRANFPVRHLLCLQNLFSTISQLRSIQ